jgi:UDP-N-acetylglucosamine 2-epimerase (non-hydrolysing)
MREVTERPEGVEAGAVKVVGTKREDIVGAAAALLGSKAEYDKMVITENPYGDGHAAEKITDVVMERID